ncbi:asparaginase [Nocardia iowensis]|uniref:Asparaginase n=1 Tax=Nocardia iowensis TaxID=204891 RepID=A0ABX8RSG4_NOCIO|nr:asparaginase [Nocardia iowensis]QXN91932.1 asparaginase [Nocardia iowensis]
MSSAEIRPRVIVFALGGTIAMSRTSTGGVAPALSADQLIAAIPGLGDTEIEVEVVDFRQLPGASLKVSDVTALADAIDDRLANADGAVVTQGTDTIEETAYLLDLLHTAAQPVVVTGAMRNPTLAGADGPANLLAAIQTAADPQARHQGCLVVFGDEIHAARRVRKTHTTSTATFQSANGGPLGYIVEGHPRLLNHLTHRTNVPAKPVDDTRVAIMTIVLGDDGTTLRAVSEHVDGLVIAGLGAGHVPADLVPILENLASRIPVVLACRTGAGSVLESTYGFPGSERDLLSRGLISAGYLDPIKARILLHTLLATDCDNQAIAAAFGAAGGYRDPETWPWPTDLSEGN